MFDSTKVIRSRSAVLGAALLFVSSLATAATAATPSEPQATRIEVAVDGLENAPVQTFSAFSVDLGVTNSGSTSGGGGGAGKAALERLVLTKAIDTTSSKLLQAALQGRHLRSVTVRVFQRPTRDAKETLILEVIAADVLVRVHHEAASTIVDASASAERVELDASSVTFTYPLEGTSLTFTDPAV